MAGWSEGLHGNTTLDEGFAGLVRGLGAEAGAIARTYPGRPFPQIVALHDARAQDAVSRPLRGSYATNLFGAYLQNARPATIWLASEHADESDAVAGVGLHVWQVARHMREMAVLTLTADPSFRDHVELHFRERLDDQTLACLNAVLPAVARIWTGRQVGLVTAQVVENRKKDESQPDCPPSRPLLGISNPAGLSRAEFRVCVMLSRGLSVRGVAAEVGLTEATVRSHLRSIYAKTGTRSLAELVFRLLDQGTQSADNTRRRA
ncbi:helix-turn-helix transcriptional regulator [Albidovulum sediminicola]|uniref:Helix-turn-helix transcriptional regulator n=1 Tax=Albidovulum sediminicola TaxID=2984331 RepID=A0ABT2Z3A2_9RHOB|nr:helix-turn-helix transcriptional regulator [Defluviimonas sp. WL0075]MCV2865629.1 helix-turn-helix transcriptional regulator [Defluviimonas sp. WL0075]